jgi:outer membrane protein OmpA-like peptidoglycan-associated protein
VRRALFFIALAVLGCSGREAETSSGERVDSASWVATAGQPAVGREHAAVLPLADGRVLISGGFDALGAPLASSEVFDPATEQWSPGPSLSVARGKSAVAGDAILGGLAATPRPDGDRYLGVAGFAPLPFLSQGRFDAAAVQLPGGVLLVMGGTGASAPLSSSEFSTAGGAWSSGGTLFNARTRATATALASGQVLVTGGVGGLGTLAGTELRQLDGGYRAGPVMSVPRVRHTATRLLSGDVLLVGGDGDAGLSAELFVAATSTLRAVAPPLQPRAGHTATLLSDGRVLLAGGRGATAAEVFDPDGGRFEIAGCLVRPREAHAAAAVDAGVLLAFGRGDGGVLAHSERLVAGGGLSRGAACTADCQCGSGHCVDGVCCDRACDRGCETCGVTGVCRTVPNSKVCRPSTAVCDLEEVCDGVSPACPANRLVGAGVVCRSANGVCDVGEACTGASPLCPADARRPAGTLCRAAVAACDLPESCDGDGGACPADALAGPATVCRPVMGECDLADLCSGVSAFCPADATVTPGTRCRGAGNVCDAEEVCTGGPLCPADGYAAPSVACGDYACEGTAPVCRTSCEGDGDCASSARCDAGVCLPYKPPPKKYVGFGCAQADSGSAWLVGAALALFGVRGRRRARGAAAAVLLLASGARAATPEPGFLHTGTDGHHGFALRLDALLLKDLVAVPFGGEVGLTLALSERFDLGAWVSIGRYPGARLGVTLHTRDDGERFRPFLQLRGLVHPVPQAVAFGAGLFGGATAALGPGRLVLGLLFEGYAGPPDYVPAGLYLLLGYQWDVYRAPDPRQRRIAVAPSVEEPTKAEEPPPSAPTPAPALAPEPYAESPPPAPEDLKAPEERTRVVTRIQIREQLFFGERQVKLDANLKARAKRVAAALKLLPQVKKLEVAGHADDAADAEKCLALGQKRAEAVVDALVAGGVSRELLVVKSYGKTVPLVSSVVPPRKREKNRRVEFNVLEMASP